MTDLTGKCFALTSGGTGGHMFPLTALARALARRGAKVIVLTDDRGARFTEGLDNVTTHVLSAGGIAGRGTVGRVIGACRLGIGVLQAAFILASARPSVVIGFGGYAAIPATLTAPYFGIKLVLHEQNAVLGRANRWLAGKAARIATSFEKLTGPASNAYTDRHIWTGNPVRDDIAAKSDFPFPGFDEGSSNAIKLLVMGGSQGARILSDVVPEALKALPEAMRARLHVAQQCRPEDLNRVTQAYKECGINVTLKRFFDDVPERLSTAHLIIARAGASTCAELTALGRPSILVPYPHAIDDHQRANAQQLDEVGACWMMPQDHFTVEALSQRIADLIALPNSLTTAADCARKAGRADAAERLADVVADVSGNGKAVSPPVASEEPAR